MTDFRLAATGTYVITCVHGREKRRVTDLAVDLAREKPHLCSCCENLFTRRDDVPHYCPDCGGHPIHPLAAPLAPPTGVV